MRQSTKGFDCHSLRVQTQVAVGHLHARDVLRTYCAYSPDDGLQLAAGVPSLESLSRLVRRAHHEWSIKGSRGSAIRAARREGVPAEREQSSSLIDKPLTEGRRSRSANGESELRGVRTLVVRRDSGLGGTESQGSGRERSRARLVRRAVLLTRGATRGSVSWLSVVRYERQAGG